MIIFSSYELSPTQELEVQKILEQGRKKYALIQDIIWESPLLDEEAVADFESEIEED